MSTSGVVLVNVPTLGTTVTVAVPALYNVFVLTATDTLVRVGIVAVVDMAGIAEAVGVVVSPVCVGVLFQVTGRLTIEKSGVGTVCTIVVGVPPRENNANGATTLLVSTTREEASAPSTGILNEVSIKVEGLAVVLWFIKELFKFLNCEASPAFGLTSPRTSVPTISFIR